MSLRRRILGPAVALAIAVGLGLATVLGLGDGLGSRPPGAPPGPGEVAEPSWEAIVEATQAQQWPRVEALLRDWVDRREDDGKARIMLGQMLVSTDRRSEGARVLAGVGADDPSYADARTQLGELALSLGDAPRAEVAFRQAAEADPKAVAPRGRLIYLLGLQLRSAEARDVLWQLHEATGDARMLVDLILDAAKSEVDVRGISPEIGQFLDGSPDDAFLRRAYGLSLHWKGEFSAALPHLEAAASGLVDDPIGRLALAECRAQLGLPVELPGAMGTIPDPPADASRWWVSLGQLQQAEGRPGDALESFRRAVALNPESPEAHHRLSQELSRSGDDVGAAEHSRRAEELRRRWVVLRRNFTDLRSFGFEEDAELLARLGDQCRDASLLAEARAWYEHAIGRDPGSPAASRLAALAGRTDPFPVARSRPRRVAGPAGADRDRTPGPGPDAPPTARFEDVAASAGIAYQYDHGPRDEIYLADTMGGGVGLLDFDGDGRLDLYFVNGCPMPYDRDDPPAPNRLYRNLGAWRFEDVTESAGVGGHGYGMGCAVADYDDDGHEDLFITGLDRTVLYRNNGDGTFEDVTESAGVASDRWTTAAGFGDFDRDGDLDLFVVTYVEDDSDAPRPCRDHAGRPVHCSPAHSPAQQDLLFRNEGDGTFADASVGAGIEAPAGRGLGLAIADFDGDSLLDAYVANDASPDFLFRNLGGLRFEEVGAASGLALDGSGHATASMGVVADDLVADGLIDLLHTNFLNEANTLHRNLGGGQFADATLSGGLAAPSLSTTGFGTAAVDADNDGTLDLFVANGHVDDQPWVNSPMPQPPQLFLGRGGGRFTLADADAFPYLSRRVVGRGLASGDLDDDGRADLVVVHRGSPAAVLRNVTEGGHWLGLRLIGTRSPRTPVGARVEVEAGGLRIVRWLTSGTGYLSAHDNRLWLGLGAAEAVDRLEIHWPSGLRQSIAGLAADRRYELREGGEPSPMIPPPTR
ncbi:FG-GAP-like repeat-containing protein [Tautonia plasticadhaerens]|uniref:ASPIC and UnbV n=1 Tax=Tautonia plasticadhaerens TaxID=2527974 RepID=A0A518HCP7_9BACT|nr:FG-GAP-like repeat-containing protein [Tautonia plasticadhaerens]QDV38638.1 ASPIC and UnbV [Tautonia plasticadhaerens]